MWFQLLKYAFFCSIRSFNLIESHTWWINSRTNHFASSWKNCVFPEYKTFFKCWPSLLRTSFWPPSMVYISIILCIYLFTYLWRISVYVVVELSSCLPVLTCRFSLGSVLGHYYEHFPNGIWNGFWKGLLSLKIAELLL